VSAPHAVLIVTGQPLIGFGLKLLLAERFAIAASWFPGWDDAMLATNAGHALECVLCDEAAAGSMPAGIAGRRRQVVILTDSDAEHERYRAVNIHVEFESLVERLAFALRAARGEPVQRSGRLSDREIEVLTLLARGLITKEIADRLGLSTHTVISHRKRISAKLGIRSTPGLTVYATIHGYVEPDSVL
jgi:DNA-binding CsgD family transcriptional regulator